MVRRPGTKLIGDKLFIRANATGLKNKSAKEFAKDMREVGEKVRVVKRPGTKLFDVFVRG